MEKTKLDWQYIRSEGIANVIRFVAYSIIRKAEHIGYRLLPERSPAELWK